jgi:hypothetical protein
LGWADQGRSIYLTGDLVEVFDVGVTGVWLPVVGVWVDFTFRKADFYFKDVGMG